MMSQRTPAPPWRSRNGSPSVRGRGGIQKRRAGAGPARVDKDGDLDMDAGFGVIGRGRSGKGRLESPVPSGPRGAGRGRGTPPPRLGNHRTTQINIERGLRHQNVNVVDSRINNGGTTLQVDGLKLSKAASNPDGGLESLEGFLERKASALDSKSNRVVKIKKSQLKGDSVLITASPDDIEQILKLDQFQFAGTILSIKACEPASPRGNKAERKNGGVSASTQETKEKLKAILACRYNVERKILDLSALGQDAGLIAMGLGSLDAKTSSKLFPALMAVCDGLFDSYKAKRDAIVGVTLAGNALSHVTSVTTLAQTFPDLKNLDLSNNNFVDMKGLESWRWKFRNLENLILTGNPIEIQQPDYTAEILKWYPKLLTLNGVQHRTAEQIAAAAAIANSPIPISGPDFRDVGQVGENFVKQFFPLYDSDRTALLSTFYDSQSLFSLSINMSAPRDRNRSTPIPPWAPYIHQSRNLIKITTVGARMSRQYRGPQNILPIWSGFPATRHPDLSSQMDKYLIECHPVPGLADPSGQSPRGVDGLILTIHGEYEEEVKPTEKGLRSFSRTFVLGPGAPSGPPIRVVSDMTVLRAHSPLAMPSQTANPSRLPPDTSIEQQQKEMATRQLVEKTGMTPDYAILCLTENGWDLEKAFAAFNANKDKLPPDAFLVNVPR